ncbi:MAG: hypothetical protein IRY95_07645 [Clostridia bacterium]|nr:hypothetical protein [Clostridia bacterium]
MIRVFETVPSMERINARFHLANAAAIRVGELYFLSGMTGLDPETGEVVMGDFREHALRALDNIRLVLEEIGLSADHVVKVNAYLKDPADFPVWNEVFISFFRSPHPCRCTVGSPLVVGAVEVDVVAASEPRV